MAKVAFGKLQLIKNVKVNSFEFNDQTIEVIQYLPLDKKTEMYERILASSVDDNGYYNITKINFWIDIEIIFTYTNISFTEKQKEDLFKLYDLFKGSGLLKLVKENMNPDELAEIIETVWDQIKAIYKHATSAVGVLQAISTDYDNLNLDVEDLQEKLANPDNLALVKNVLTKLG